MGFIAGLIVGAGGTFATMVYAHMNWQERDDTIVFPMKVFYEDENDTRVLISGTLTGPELSYPNNTYTISCLKDAHECSIGHIDQIGTNQIGRLEVAYSISIAQWNASEVIASEDDINPFCQKTTVTLDRKAKTALWLDVPNQYC